MEEYHVEPLWTIDLALGATAMAPPRIVGENCLFATVGEGHLRSIRIGDGRLLWEQPLSGSVLRAMAVDGNMIFIPCIEQNIFFVTARDVATGALIWQRPIASDVRRIIPSSSSVFVILGSPPGVPTPAPLRVVELAKADGIVRRDKLLFQGAPILLDARPDGIDFAMSNDRFVRRLSFATLLPEVLIDTGLPIRAGTVRGSALYLALGSDDGGGGLVRAYDRTTRTARWTGSTFTPASALFASAKSVIASCRNPAGPDLLFCLQEADGRRRWLRDAGYEPLPDHCGLFARGSFISVEKDAENGILAMIIDEDEGLPRGEIAAEWGQGWVVDTQPLILVSSIQSIFALHPNRLFSRAASADVRAAPAIAGRQIFVGDAGGNLTCWTLADGKQRWKSSFAAPLEGTPAVQGGRVYVGHGSGYAAVDAVSGAVKWNRPLSEPVVAPLLIDGDKLVFGGRDGSVRLVAQTDGAPVWSFATGGPIDAACVADTRGFYVGSRDGTFYALNREGVLRWTLPTIDEIRTAALVAGGSAIFANAAGELHAVDAASGDLRWAVSLPGPVLNESPILHLGKLWIANASRILRLDPATGGVEGQIEGLGRLTGALVPFGGELFVSSLDGELCAINPATMAVSRRLPIGKPLYAPPAVATPYLIAADEPGGIHTLLPEGI